MYKVRTFNQIALRGLERFPRDGFEVGTEISDPHAILLRSHVLTADHVTPNLRAVARAGAGVNNVPVEHYTERGIVVFNTPGANANSVKELVLAALLLSARDVLGGLGYVASIKDVADPAELNKRVEAEKKRFQGEEIYGKTLGVVGLGAIGALVAEAGLRLGMKVLGYDPAISVDAAWRLPSDVQKMENLPTLFARSDYVTLHVPLLDETRNMINDESLKAFRPGTVLLNFARQEIVDEAALSRALGVGPVGALLFGLPVAAAGATAQRLGNAAPRREHGGSGGKLRGDGRRSADRLPSQRQHPQFGELPYGEPRTHRRRPDRGHQSQRSENARTDPVGAGEQEHQRHRHDQQEPRRRCVQPDRRGRTDSGRPVAGNQPDRQRDERAGVRTVVAVRRGRRGADRAAPAASETASIRKHPVPRACTARIRR